MARKVLTANDGMVLTDGNVYGKTIYLAEGSSVDGWREITEAEYEEIQRGEQAEVADYMAALERFGV